MTIKSAGVRGDFGGGSAPLDVDDQAMWDAARPAPLSGEALRRIAVKMRNGSGPREAAARRWQVWAAASLLLLIGGAAGAAVATFVTRHPGAELTREPSVKKTRPARAPRARLEATAPDEAAVVTVAPPTPEPPPAPAPSLSPSPSPSLSLSPPVAVAPPAAVGPAAPRRRVSPVQLAMRAPTTSAAPVTPPVAPPPPSPFAPSVFALAPPAPPAPEPAPPSASPPPALAPTARPPASAEAGLLRAVLTALHRNDDPASALALLDQYDARYPKGTLRGEATLARALSLRELGRDDELLRLLERVSFAEVPRAAELRVLRAELRLTRRRFADALPDFEAALGAGAPDPIIERALFGRASCRFRLGDADGARADLRRFLERFPASPRAAEVRASLAR